ncbi:hypothetical protein PG985_005847 [Apiospora marii]|uniref:uncharacterized protein n=1 Tax=Apiospora marii TaxID=335849 RepID=UPI0031301CD2
MSAATSWARPRTFSTPAPTTICTTAKALLFGGQNSASAILQSGTAGHARKLGCATYIFDPRVWGAEEDFVVRRGNPLKFLYPILPGNMPKRGARLVEANPTATDWGANKLLDAASWTSAVCWRYRSRTWVLPPPPTTLSWASTPRPWTASGTGRRFSA